MKKLFVALFVLFSFTQTINAQQNQETDYSVISKFLNAVISQDVNTLTDVLHYKRYNEINKLIYHSEMFGFKGWQIVGKRYYEDGTPSYIVAMSVENRHIEIEGIDGYISPSKHLFLYERFIVTTEGNRKYIDTNADMMTIVDVERFLRENGTTLPNKFYTNYRY